MNYATIKPFDVANGPGVRVSVFVSGCTHHCKGCFNQEAWDFSYGSEFTQETMEKILSYLEPTHIKGLSLLGGEPFEYRNQQGLLPLLREVKRRFPQKDIWCYSGYRFDEDILEKMCKEYEVTREMVSYLDVLVDGKFVLEQKNINLRFRGSANQRIIKVKESLRENKIILWEEK
jgi:anaerobic ribonucleoside-triphosphate reductase activating protein